MRPPKEYHTLLKYLSYFISENAHTFSLIYSLCVCDWKLRKIEKHRLKKYILDLLDATTFLGHKLWAEIKQNESEVGNDMLLVSEDFI